MQQTQPQWLSRMTPLLPNLENALAALEARISAESDESEQLRMKAQQAYLLEIRESIETLKVTYPVLTFEHRLTLQGSTRSVDLRSLGQAHTACDTILYLPADSVIFAGDVIAVHNHPLFTDGDPQSWLHALDELDKLDAQQIIPGHGPVSDATCIGSMKQYITDLLSICDHYRGSSIQPAVSGIPVPEAYQNWNASGVFQRNLEFLLGK